MLGEDVAIATAYGVVSIGILICMRADIIGKTGGRCVISDLSRCVITINQIEIGALFDMANSGGSRDRACAWVVPRDGARAWRYLAARMAYLGYARRVFTDMSAALVWVQREALLPL